MHYNCLLLIKNRIQLNQTYTVTLGDKIEIVDQLLKVKLICVLTVNNSKILLSD